MVEMRSGIFWNCWAASCGHIGKPSVRVGKCVLTV